MVWLLSCFSYGLANLLAWDSMRSSRGYLESLQNRERCGATPRFQSAHFRITRGSSRHSESNSSKQSGWISGSSASCLGMFEKTLPPGPGRLKGLWKSKEEKKKTSSSETQNFRPFPCLESHFLQTCNSSRQKYSVRGRSALAIWTLDNGECRCVLHLALTLFSYNLSSQWI